MIRSAGDILGAYEVRSLLGKGGMGEMYLAHDTKLGRDVSCTEFACALGTEESTQEASEAGAFTAKFATSGFTKLW